MTSTMGFGVFPPSSVTQFARTRKPTEKQNSGVSGLYAVNCGGKNLGKTCPLPVFPAGASLPVLEPDKPPVELEADRNSATKSLELSSDWSISGLKHKFITGIRACRFVRWRKQIQRDTALSLHYPWDTQLWLWEQNPLCLVQWILEKLFWFFILSETLKLVVYGGRNPVQGTTQGVWARALNPWHSP